MSLSAEPFAEVSATFERQLVARADRLPERRASHTVTPTMAATPSKIHSHKSEVPGPLAPGDGEGGSVDGDGAGAGATAGVVTVGGVVEGAPEGLGDLVRGGNVGGEDSSVDGEGTAVGASAGAVSVGEAAEGAVGSGVALMSDHHPGSVGGRVKWAKS